MQDQKRSRVRQLAQEYIQRGDATGWFEALYAGAEGNEGAIPWADRVANPNLVGWLDQQQVRGEGRRALVVGCGLGDDAEELARRGFVVTAFDISPTAVAWCQKLYPDSPVKYVAANVLEVVPEWRRSFDFIFEAYTLQVLGPELRARAIPHIAEYVAPRGKLLVVCRGREPEDYPGDMPWPLTTAEMEQFQAAGLQEVEFEDYMDQEEEPRRRFRVQYKRIP